MIHRVAVRGDTYHVSKATGSDDNSGLSWRTPFLTVAKGITAAGAYGKVRIAGVATGYDEALTIAKAKTGLVLEGVGPRGSAWIVPAAASATPLIVHADDVTLLNLGLQTNGAGTALEYYGARLRAYESKLEGGALCVKATKGTAAQIAALTHGDGSDALFEDCELAWSTDGVELAATDYGACTQQRFRRCLLHNLTGRGVKTSGNAQETWLRYRDLWLEDCEFANLEDGTEPTYYLDLDPGDFGVSFNTGRVSSCRFPVAKASGKIVTAAKLVRSGNFYSDGHD